MQDIFITGGAMTPFGRHPGVMAPELAQQAILKAIDDAGIDRSEIQAIYCANVLGGMILGQLIVRDLGLAWRSCRKRVPRIAYTAGSTMPAVA